MKISGYRPVAAIVAVSAVISLGPMLAGCATVLTLAVSPKTLLDRAIEARSAEDIYIDNRIVIEVNAIMAKLRAFSVSTEIYEQRLLLTGLIDDKNRYNKFRIEIKKIREIKELYWHIRYMNEAEQKRRATAGKMIGWADTLLLDTRVGLALVAERGVADVNYRVAADAFSHVYVIGRARSRGELNKALAASRGIESATEIINYVEVRP